MMTEKLRDPRTDINDPQVQEWYLKPAGIDEETAKLHAQFFLNCISEREEQYAQARSRKMPDGENQPGMDLLDVELRKTFVKEALLSGIAMITVFEEIITHGSDLEWDTIEANYKEILGDERIRALQRLHQDLYLTP